jgi:hypothetical protein
VNTCILEEHATSIFENGVIRVRMLVTGICRRELQTTWGRGFIDPCCMYLSYFTVSRKVCINEMIAWKLPIEWDVNVFKLYMSVNCCYGDNMVFDN